MINNILKLIKLCLYSERFERKIPLKNGQSIYYKNNLISKGFCQIFKSRSITSIYFDTRDYLFARQNINGENLRVKARIRYYNSDYNNAVLELKFKKNYNNYKKVFDHSLYLKKKKFTEVVEYYQSLSSKILLIELLPSSVISYKRSYYKNNNIRLTVDTNLKAYKYINRKYIAKNLLKLNFDVIEFKYEKKLDNLFRNKFSNLLNISARSKKCSKYIYSICRF